MKKIVYNILLATSLLLVSCEENELKLQANDFSDVSFICTQLVNQWSDNIIEVGTPISFMDLSQNAITHTWSIEEGSCFLRGEYSENDTTYDDYIIEGAGTATTDIIAYVLFNEPSNDVGVKLNNSFKHEVTYTAFPDDMSTTVTFPFEWTIGSEYNSATGLWDFEAEYIFKVLDKVDASVQLYANDELIAEVAKGVSGDESEMESWETVEITTDDVIKVVVDVYGEPDTINETYSSILKDYETLTATSEVISTDPKITRLTSYYFPSALEAFSLGQIVLRRSSGDSSTGITIPTGSATKILPLNINVSMGEKELEAVPTVTAFDQITFSANSTLSTLPSTIMSDITVVISNADKNITSESIEIKSVALNSSKTGFVVTLDENIYVDDTITLTYSPIDKAITDSYGRELAEMVIEQPAFFDPVVTDPVNRGFEGTQTSDKNITGWWIQHEAYWSYSQEQQHTGNNSLKFYNDGSDTESTTDWTCQSLTSESELSGDAGTYILKAWVWVGSDAQFVSDIIFAITSPTGTVSSTASTLFDATPEEWFEIEREYTVPTELVEASTKINIKMSNSNIGTLYVDDVSLEMKQTRP